MIAAESTRGRRIVGRLDRGQNLLDALATVCREHQVRSGEVRAVGALETAEVASYDQANKKLRAARTLTGSLEILHLHGNVSERDGHLALQLHATLLRERDTGVEVLGGRVLAARVFALEFVVESFDDLILRRAPDAATGLHQWGQSIALAAGAAPPPPPPKPVAPPQEPDDDAPAHSPTWNDVAAASATPLSGTTPRASAAGGRLGGRAPTPPPPDDDEDEEPVATGDTDDEDPMSAGDVLIHPTFGRCEVQRIEGSYEYAHVRLKNGRLVRLSLDVLKVFAAGAENGHKLFRAQVSG